LVYGNGKVYAAGVDYRVQILGPIPTSNVSKYGMKDLVNVKYLEEDRMGDSSSTNFPRE
jgi:hypothetical protein